MYNFLYMKRSLSALLLAIILHVVLLLLFVALLFLIPSAPHTLPKKEERIKVSLKERPQVTRDAIVKNAKPHNKAPSIPKGKQLKKIIDKPLINTTKPLPKPLKRPKPPSQNITSTRPKPKREPIPSKKPYIRAPKKEPVTPPKPSSLYDMLSTPSTAPQPKAVKPLQNRSRINQDIQELYGDTFSTLSAGEQKYIIDNQEIMRRITQKVLNRVGSVNLRGNLHVNAHNIVEFYLYPNGDISEIRLIQKSGYYILDHTTKETIEYAYAKYPRPEQKTLIRYKVGYYLRRY